MHSARALQFTFCGLKNSFEFSGFFASTSTEISPFLSKIKSTSLLPSCLALMLVLNCKPCKKGARAFATRASSFCSAFAFKFALYVANVRLKFSNSSCKMGFFSYKGLKKSFKAKNLSIVFSISFNYLSQHKASKCQAKGACYAHK